MPLNLNDYCVLNSERSKDSRTVLVELISRETACTDCGGLPPCLVLSDASGQNVDIGGKDIDLWVKKPRLVCLEESRAKKSFVQVTVQVPLRSCLTTRLVGRIVEDYLNEICTITDIAQANQVARPTVLLPRSSRPNIFRWLLSNAWCASSGSMNTVSVGSATC